MLSNYSNFDKAIIGIVTSLIVMLVITWAITFFGFPKFDTVIEQTDGFVCATDKTSVDIGGAVIPFTCSASGDVSTGGVESLTVGIPAGAENVNVDYEITGKSVRTCESCEPCNYETNCRAEATETCYSDCTPASCDSGTDFRCNEPSNSIQCSSTKCERFCGAKEIRVKESLGTVTCTDSAMDDGISRCETSYINLPDGFGYDKFIFSVNQGFSGSSCSNKGYDSAIFFTDITANKRLRDDITYCNSGFPFGHSINAIYGDELEGHSVVAVGWLKVYRTTNCNYIDDVFCQGTKATASLTAWGERWKPSGQCSSNICTRQSYPCNEQQVCDTGTETPVPPDCQASLCSSSCSSFVEKFPDNPSILGGDISLTSGSDTSSKTQTNAISKVGTRTLTISAGNGGGGISYKLSGSYSCPAPTWKVDWSCISTKLEDRTSMKCTRIVNSACNLQDTNVRIDVSSAGNIDDSITTPIIKVGERTSVEAKAGSWYSESDLGRGDTVVTITYDIPKGVEPAKETTSPAPDVPATVSIPSPEDVPTIKGVCKFVSNMIIWTAPGESKQTSFIIENVGTESAVISFAPLGELNDFLTVSPSSIELEPEVPKDIIISYDILDDEEPKTIKNSISMVGCTDTTEKMTVYLTIASRAELFVRRQIITFIAVPLIAGLVFVLAKNRKDKWLLIIGSSIVTLLIMLFVSPMILGGL